MTTVEEEHPEEWRVADPVDGMVNVLHEPSGEEFEITIADVRGTPSDETKVYKGMLDDYLRGRAIHIAAQRRLLRSAD